MVILCSILPHHVLGDLIVHPDIQGIIDEISHHFQIFILAVNPQPSILYIFYTYGIKQIVGIPSVNIVDRSYLLFVAAGCHNSIAVQKSNGIIFVFLYHFHKFLKYTVDNHLFSVPRHIYVESSSQRLLHITTKAIIRFFLQYWQLFSWILPAHKKRPQSSS